LDVVREAVERLHGSVTAQTARGAGTTITVTVPLSVASFDALIVDADGARFAIPLDAVCGALRIDPKDIIRTEGRETVIFDGSAVPLVSLKHLVHASAESSMASGRASAVVVRGASGTAATAVDRLAETMPIVMRPLPALAAADALAAGAALDDAGDPFLILDPDHLVAGAARAGSAIFEADPARVPVLVVDDSLTTRMLEQSILESAGFDVDLAASGEEALYKARARRYALFLVDVEMPGMDGFAFIERIRADLSLREIPAVLVTSRNTLEDRRRADDVGAQGYMVKSEFDQERLLEHIRRLIG
jgi:two-component system chemotaxis sensor kinase CheA